jgi:hypothetical protein
LQSTLARELICQCSSGDLLLFLLTSNSHWDASPDQAGSPMVKCRLSALSHRVGKVRVPSAARRIVGYDTTSGEWSGARSEIINNRPRPDAIPGRFNVWYRIS